MRCRHCHKTFASRPRGLCWACFQRLPVRELYPHSTSRYARRGLALGYIRPRLPAFPTQAPPGSPEKIAVMSERARLKQELFHPDDATLAGAALTPLQVG